MFRKSNFGALGYFSQDVLVFLTGQEEIEAVAHTVRLAAKVCGFVLSLSFLNRILIEKR